MIGSTPMNRRKITASPARRWKEPKLVVPEPRLGSLSCPTCIRLLKRNTVCEEDANEFKYAQVLLFIIQFNGRIIVGPSDWMIPVMFPRRSGRLWTLDDGHCGRALLRRLPLLSHRVRRSYLFPPLSRKSVPRRTLRRSSHN